MLDVSDFLSKVILVDAGATCSLDICKSENYTFQFDPKNRDADNSYETILSKFYVQDVVEVNTKHQYINLEMGIVLGWRDQRLKCRNQVIIFAKYPSYK